MNENVKTKKVVNTTSKEELDLLPNSSTSKTMTNITNKEKENTIMREETMIKIKGLLEEEVNETNERIIKILEEERELNNELRQMMFSTLNMVNMLMQNIQEQNKTNILTENELQIEKEEIIPETKIEQEEPVIIKTEKKKQKEKNKAKQEIDCSFIGREAKEFEKYQKNVKTICNIIVRLSQNENHGTFRKVMKCLVDKMKNKYGICWVQEFIDFEKEYGVKAKGYMEVLFYLEQKNEVCKNMALTILLSLIDEEKKLNKVKIKGLKMPVNNMDELMKTSEIIIKETGMNDSNGASFFKKAFNFTDVFMDIDWGKYEKQYREKYHVRENKRISKIKMVNDFEELYPSYIKAFNKFIYYNFEQA